LCQLGGQCNLDSVDYLVKNPRTELPTIFLCCSVSHEHGLNCR
jgi:hypothetical protein